MSLIEELSSGVAEDIARGALRPGDRLPTHREFARTHQVALTTASRVYAELVRRGLVVGEVGRGTFVRTSPIRSAEPVNEPATGPVDLEYNFPLDQEQLGHVVDALRRQTSSIVEPASLRPGTPTGTRAAIESVRKSLLRARGLGAATPLVLTGSGRQAIAASLAAVARPGQRVGVERLTFPVVRGVANVLGIELVPLEIDSEGLDPAAVQHAHRAGPLAALYLQPRLQNPLGVDLGPRRASELARVVADHDLVVVEDAVYSFLHDDRFFASQAPERTVVVDSMSKRLAPGLTFGVVAAPPRLADRVALAARRGGWVAMSLAVDAVTALIDDGTVAEVVRLKRRDAGARQQAARETLHGMDLQAHPLAYHLWWNLPSPWRADTFVAASARAGISVTPAADFLVGTTQPPHAVRLALASPPLAVLTEALRTLREIASSSPHDLRAE